MKKMKKLLLTVLMMVSAVMLLGACTSSKEVTRGTWNGNTYTSDYAKLEFVMPEEWKSATDEELSTIMGASAEIFKESTGNKMSAKLLEMQVIYDMMAQNPVTGSSVVVMYENLALSVGGTKYTEEEYIEDAKTQIDSVSAAQGMVYTYSDVTEETLCGEKYKVFSASIEGTDISQRYHVRKTDKYMLAVLITSMDDEPILENFTSK